MTRFFLSTVFIFVLAQAYALEESYPERSNIDSVSLILFLLDDCPICIEYTKTLNSLYSEFGEDIHFIGYFPNFSSKPNKIEKYKNMYNIEFELHTDYQKIHAKKWKAEVTPEVVLFNHTTSTILYQGRIDNKFEKRGRRRNVVTKHNLRDAIQATLKGTKIVVKSTQPVGCYINYSDNIGK